MIRSRRGRFLAIPTENARKRGPNGRRISPRTFPEHGFGRCGSCRRGGPSLLAVDGLRASFSRRTGELPRLPAGNIRRPAQRTGSEHGGDARVAGEAVQAARRGTGDQRPRWISLRMMHSVLLRLDRRRPRLQPRRALKTPAGCRRRVWSRRCGAIEFVLTGLHLVLAMAADWPLAVISGTCVTSGSDP